MAEMISDSLTYTSLVNLMLQQTRVTHTKIEVLNMSDNIVGEITGYCTDGSISIDVSNMVRRTISATFVADSKLEINQTSLLWINKRLKFYLGIEKYNGDIVWFNMGIFVLSNPETSVGLDGRTISIDGSDKMILFEQPFMDECIISANTPVHEAIKALAALIDETKLLIEETTYTVPYEIQVSATDDIDSTLKDIVNLYMNYHIYYNIDGYLVFEKTKNKLTDSVLWEFSGDKNLTISRSIVTDYDSIKNHIKVLGAVNDDTGIQPKYELKIEGVDNIFSIDNIRERRNCISEDDYTTIEQCKLRCEYEMEQVQNMSRVFTIDTFPIYILNDVNKVVVVEDNGQKYTCVLDSINIPFDASSSMSITCHQIFE